jgi:hypothetical protein
MEHRSSDRGSSVGLGEAVPAWLRVGLVVFWLVLMAQAIWILLPELQRPGRIHIPADQQASLEALRDQAPARRAAQLAVVSGDLWAESALTYSSLLWTAPDTGAATGNEARVALERAARYSPHRGDVWLLLAAMADRYRWPDHKPSALLKMSYYTAPNEQALFLLRIKIALQTAALQDPELADMIERDIRVLIRKSPALKPALLAIYKAASGPNRRFVERVVSRLDPAYLADMLRASK